jgi:hypothetical protein
MNIFLDLVKNIHIKNGKIIIPEQPDHLSFDIKSSMEFLDQF